MNKMTKASNGSNTTLTSTLSMADPPLSNTTNTRKSVMHEDTAAEFESLTFYITMFHSTAPIHTPVCGAQTTPMIPTKPTSTPGQIPGM